MNNFDKLTINSEIFDIMREDFNMILQKTITKMVESKNTSADINVTLTIDLYNKYKTNEGVLNDAYTKPIIEHKVSSTIKQKTETKGLSDGEYALIWDEDLKSYIIKKIEDEQTNLTDNVFNPDETSKNTDDDIKALNGSVKPYMLNGFTGDKNDEQLSAVGG
ncbi:MAG: hypothetical protein K0S55_1384 [Clostridia bacterium]|jgi:hypothetical protein|nr:hypothetical protein [Clostridia bacterium]